MRVIVSGLTGGIIRQASATFDVNHRRVRLYRVFLCLILRIPERKPVCAYVLLFIPPHEKTKCRLFIQATCLKPFRKSMPPFIIGLWRLVQKHYQPAHMLQFLLFSEIIYRMRAVSALPLHPEKRPLILTNLYYQIDHFINHTPVYLCSIATAS